MRALCGVSGAVANSVSRPITIERSAVLADKPVCAVVLVVGNILVRDMRAALTPTLQRWRGDAPCVTTLLCTDRSCMFMRGRRILIHGPHAAMPVSAATIWLWHS